jgi:predicted RNA polymerase sigma factor
MIRTLRALFLGRLFREKLLLTGLAVIFALVWFSSLAGQAARFLRNVHGTTAALRDQTLWLSNRASIDTAAQTAASRLDASRTIDSIHLLSEVQAMATEAGLRNVNIGDTQDVSNGQFAVHTLMLTATKTDWATIIAFYVALRQRSPYIGIEQFGLLADKGNPSLLNANLRISSVEIVRN